MTPHRYRPADGAVRARCACGVVIVSRFGFTTCRACRERTLERAGLSGWLLLSAVRHQMMREADARRQA